MSNREQSAADRIDQALTWIRAQLADVDQPPPRNGNGSPPPRTKASKTAYQKWFLRAAIPVLAGAAWLLAHTKAQVATAAGIVAVLGAVTAAVLLAPGRDDLGGRPDSMPTPEAPVTTTTSPPSTTPRPSRPPTTEAPPPSERPLTTDSEPDMPEDTSAAEIPEPAPSPPPTSPPTEDTQLPDDNEDDDDGQEDERDEPDRRVQCLQVLPEFATDINACVAAVAELADEVAP